MDFEQKYKQYSETLGIMHDKLAAAEKQAIVAEANLKTLEAERAKVVKKCEELTGTTIDKVPALLKEKQAELDDIMSLLSGINLDAEITQETLDKVNAIKDKYSI